MSATRSSSTELSIEAKATRESPSNQRNGTLQIFLGGSCNPTTWRQKVAIPFLEDNGITYYNPQIDNWTPELVELERHAKQNAKVLLFVIDEQTRSTVSLIESAYMAGDDKNIVLVIYPFNYNIIGPRDGSFEKYNLVEIRRKHMKASCNLLSRNKLSPRASASSRSPPTSKSNISMLRSPTPRSSLLRTDKTPYKSSSVQVNNKNKLDIVESCELEQQVSRAIRLAGETISFSDFWELKQARSILENLISLRNIPTFSDILQALDHISCHLKNDQSSPPSSGSNNSTKSKMGQYLTEIQPQQHYSTSDEGTMSHHNPIKDIYLSIDSDDSSLMEKTIIPILKAKGLSYNYNHILDSPHLFNESLTGEQNVALGGKACFTDSLHDQTALDSLNPLGRAKLSIDKEMYAISTSRVLLFVITKRCRGLSIMVLASHFMALFRNIVVLCVQYLEEPCIIGGETLTETAVADYNRGRVYLCDYAAKSQVPVFNTIQEAIECCNRKCKHIK